jgi:hypothetical protein
MSAPSAVARVHLVGGAAPEPRRALGSLTERTVQRGGELGRVGEDRGLGEAGLVERVPDGRHLTVHHPARGDHVRPRLGLGHRDALVALQRGVVVEQRDPRATRTTGTRLVIMAGVGVACGSRCRQVGPENAAVAVVGVLAQTEVADQDHVVAEVGRQGAQGSLHDPLRRPCLGALGVLELRDAEQQQRRDPQAGQLGGLLAQALEGVLVVAGHRGDRHGLLDSFFDEQRRDQVAAGKVGLPHQPPQRRGAAQSARAAGWERGRLEHRGSWMLRLEVWSPTVLPFP